jgi:hypothetical protein
MELSQIVVVGCALVGIGIGAGMWIGERSSGRSPERFEIFTRAIAAGSIGGCVGVLLMAVIAGISALVD